MKTKTGSPIATITALPSAAATTGREERRKNARRKRPAGITPAPPPPPIDGTRGVVEGRIRAVIDAVLPCIDGGRFPLKRIAGEPITIDAHCFTDGHDKLRVILQWQQIGAGSSNELDMAALPNDVWRTEFTPELPGRYRYTVVAWIDHFESWRRELERRDDPADIRVALQVGASLIKDTLARTSDSDATILAEWSAQLCALAGDTGADPPAMKATALDAARASIVARHADRSLAATASLELVVDRKRAAFSNWYELFPRSASSEPGQHGTFKDVERRLSYIADMGFNVLYFPPIHPIGRINRKGTNNALTAKSDDVGSPWAIGAVEGGHKAILPQLGTFEDFAHLVDAARELGIEIALDIAFQCAPDHPYVTEHPAWFRHRPDGSVQYAENPPKKYQDIYPFDFESSDWRAMWNELKSVVEFWIEKGVNIFRVDNPHTKACAFWEWLISDVKSAHPEVLFLAEAFTRPKLMHRLAKLGFSQSYTYFTWRNTKYELEEYFTELALGSGRQYFRPNVWPNTPDILHEMLQSGLRPVFGARLILAATLAGNYGIYGPTYELLESAPREPGSEEYRDSEKYQLRHWALERPGSLAPLIARINRIRGDNTALQSDAGLTFCMVDNDQLIAYVKSDPTSDNVIITVVNLDPHHAQSGWLQLDIGAWDLAADQPYQLHDLLSDQRYIWRGRTNYVMLDPQRAPAHVFRLRRRVRSEQDFDYYL